jgi:hypothetical protein
MIGGLREVVRPGCVGPLLCSRSKKVAGMSILLFYVSIEGGFHRRAQARLLVDSLSSSDGISANSSSCSRQ